MITQFVGTRIITSEIQARANPNLLDLGVAMASEFAQQFQIQTVASDTDIFTQCPLRGVRRIGSPGRSRVVKNKVQQVLPTFKQQILGQTQKILKKALAGASLFSSPLITLIYPMENGVKQESQQIEG